MTTPHKPAIPTNLGLGDSNPWMLGLWFATIGAAIAGTVLTTGNLDPEAFDFDPIAATVGHSLLIVAGVLLAGLLVAGAICWQLRRR